MLYPLTLKNLLRPATALCLALSFVLLSSCGDDDDPATDSTNPEVSFANLANNAVVWNRVKATINASDDMGIQKVEVFVDGASIATFTTAPFEIDWDSNDVSDGQHVIKVEVTDASGNKTTKEVTITVKNILISIDVADDQVEVSENYQERIFVFLSDENGDVIDAAEVQNGVDIELKSETFNGATFYLTEVLYANEHGTPLSTLWTYKQVERGEWVLAHDVDLEAPEAGEANLTFSNAAPADEAVYDLTTNGSSYLSVHANNLTASPRLTKSPSQLFVLRYNFDDSPGTYGLFPSITTGTNATINLSQVNKAMTKVTIDLPDGLLDATYELQGYPVAGNYSESYDNVGYSRHTENYETLDLYYPGTAFPSYFARVYYETETMYFSSGRVNAMYNVEQLEYDVTFAVNNNTLTYSASGNYDYIGATFKNGNNHVWNFMLPKGSDQSVVIPELPVTVAGLISSNLPDFSEGPIGFRIHEIEIIDGYDGLKNFIKSSTRGYFDLEYLVGNYTGMDVYPNGTSNGRVKGKASRSRLAAKAAKRK